MATALTMARPSFRKTARDCKFTMTIYVRVGNLDHFPPLLCYPCGQPYSELETHVPTKCQLPSRSSGRTLKVERAQTNLGTMGSPLDARPLHGLTIALP